MGTALTGNTISSSYLGLIKTTDSAAISGSAKVLTDGAGNDSPLYLSTSRLGIGITPTSTLHVSGDFTLTGAFKDTSGDAGTSGQILSSTGSGTNWIDNDTGDITSVVAGDGLTGGGTSGAVTINAGAGNLIDVQADQIDVDLSELTTSTSNADGDFFAVIDDANAQKKLTKGDINLSGFNNDLSIPTVSGTTNKIAKFTASTTVGDSVITEVSSEIGINIASPQEILHQHIGSTSTNYHQFTNSTTGSAVNNGLLVGINSAGEAQILNKLNSANAKIRLATYAGTTIMDLNGNIEADNGSNGDQYLRISNDDSGTAAEATIYVSNSGTNSDGLFAGVAGTSFTTASGFVQDGAHIGSGTGASGGLSIMTRAAADMRFYTNGHDNERMRITSAGKVGIGIQSPHNDVSGLSIAVAGSTDQLYLERTGSGTGRYYLGTSSNEFFIVDDVAASTRLKIDSSGNVGIGTTSPTSITGYTVLEINNATNGGILDLSQGDTMRGRLVATTSSFTLETSGTIPMNFSPGGSTQMTITSGGDVGIGITSPTTHYQKVLHIHEPSGSSALHLTNNTTGSTLNDGIDFVSYEDDFYLLNREHTAGKIFIGVTNDGTPTITTDHNKRAIIGDTSSDAKLKVSATEYPENTELIAHYICGANGSTSYLANKYFLIENSFTGAAYPSPMLVFKNNASASNTKFYSAIYADAAGGISFETAAAQASVAVGTTIGTSQKMLISNDGNVGIGATSPSQKLHVAGALRLDSASDRKIDFLRTGGNHFSIEHDTSQIYFYNHTTSKVAFLINNDGTIEIGRDVIDTALLTVESDNDQGISIGYGSGTNEYRRLYQHSTGLYFKSSTNQAYLSAAGAWTDASDISIKKDIVEIKYGLDDVLKTKPRSYKMKSDDEVQIGFVAQEIKEIIPEVVTDVEDKPLGVSYGKLVAVAFKAIQEQQEIINDLKTRIETLEK